MLFPEAAGASRATVSPVWNRVPLQLILHQRGIKSRTTDNFSARLYSGHRQEPLMGTDEGGSSAAINLPRGIIYPDVV